MKDVNGTVNGPEIWRSPVEGKVVYLVIYRIYPSKRGLFWISKPSTLGTKTGHSSSVTGDNAESTTRLRGGIWGEISGTEGGKIVQIVVGGFFSCSETPLHLFTCWMRLVRLLLIPMLQPQLQPSTWHVTNLRHCRFQMIMVNGIPWNRPCWNTRSGMMEWNGGMAGSSLLKWWF